MEKIIITIPDDFNEPVSVRTEGINGPSCKTLTAGLEKAFGNVVSNEMTPEFNQAQAKVNRPQQLRQ